MHAGTKVATVLAPVVRMAILVYRFKLMGQHTSIFKLLLAVLLQLGLLIRTHSGCVASQMSIWTRCRSKTLQQFVISFDNLLSCTVCTGIYKLLQLQGLHAQFLVFLLQQLSLLLYLQVKFLCMFVKHLLLHSQ